MDSLERIQKTVTILQILSRVAAVFSFIGAFAALVGITATIHLGENFSIIERVFSIEDVASKQAIGILASDAVVCIIEGVLFVLANNYLTSELKAGTPFTVAGAREIRNLGILTMVLPIVSLIICAVISGIFNFESERSMGNGMSIVLGAGLLAFSFVAQYGAELEEKAKPQIPENTAE